MDADDEIKKHERLTGEFLEKIKRKGQKSWQVINKGTGFE